MNTRSTIQAIAVIMMITISTIMDSGFTQSDPILDIRTALEAEVLTHQQYGDRAKLADVVTEGRGLFDAVHSYKLYKTFHKDHRTLELIYDHLTSFEPYCPDGSLRSNLQEPYRTYNSVSKQREPVTVTLKDVVNVFGQTDQ